MRRDATVALHGAYYTNNFGDILLMAIFRRWLEGHPGRPSVRVPFLTGDVTGDARGSLERWRDLLGARALVFGGGGYFGEPATNRQRWGLRLMARYDAAGEAMRALGRPYAVLGVGVGPISNRAARRATVRLFEGASRVAVRDEPSRAYLLEYGLSPDKAIVTADAAIALRAADLPDEARRAADAVVPEEPGVRTIVVHLSHPSARDARCAALMDEVVAVLRDAPAVRVVAITDQGGAGGQEAAAAELAEKLGGRCTVHRYREPWTLCALLARASLVLTTKLHVGIVGAALGTPVLSFPTHAKTPRFYAQIGAPERCTPLDELRPGDAAERLRDALSSDLAPVRIPDAVRSAALANRAEAHAFLDGLDLGAARVRT